MRVFLSVALVLCSVLPAFSVEPLRDIVFGSCLDTHEHPMLDRTLTLPRDLFIFMGDNVYADKGGIPMMKEKYALLKQSRFYQGLKAKGSILATWDDHDFGLNDGGADYPHKREAQTEFWNWLDEPADSPRRQQEGVYHAQTFGPEGKRVQVILLDTRYFRSPLKKLPAAQALVGGRYTATDDTRTTMLGEAQWAWLEKTLREPAELRLIVSSIEFAAEMQGFESWANLPHEQQHMIDILKRTQAQGVLFLTGDRHWCELSRIDGPGYLLYDLTASSMTQKHPRGTPTKNKHRVLPKTYHLPNVGTMNIDWQADPLITMKIIDLEGNSQLEQTLRLSELKAKP